MTWNDGLRRGAAGVALLAVAATSACGGGEPIQQTMSSVATTTTRLASANIVGLDREPDAACAAPTRATGAPARIVVADPALLDGLCALGLQERVVGIAGVAPAYLGSVLAKTPRATGAARNGDVVLGTSGSAGAEATLGHATVLPSPAAGWRASFTALAAAVHMPTEARAVLARYDKDVKTTSVSIDAPHQMVSLVRFTADGAAYAEGTTPLAAQVLADLGVERPAAQRRPEPVRLTGDDFSAADADLVYASYEGDKGQKSGMAIMESAPWLHLRAVVAKRQLLVEDASWYSPGGPVAANAVLHDVQTSIRSSS
ncbi:ABC transporter substrate-binding protein [Tsukamurella sp. 8F]|uniref:ABC transporter substrate-binding protein n=1 Tax=unclassified Tsukamurella TaxID=2633480 RepID=UPI0023B9E903|nr:MULTISPECIES: ABC transporter substrate-binding protein [unclassified Tsukamurella]MDF0529753.1 ABC transporter substrate-binding protein [Tsukamurella sp. 8J]MDF0586038.1 ABC transporter substrate-binding protein [Tsukamurella sp. 8F]